MLNKVKNKYLNKIIDYIFIIITPSFFSFIYYIVRFFKAPSKNSIFLAYTKASILILMIPMFDIVYTYNSFLYFKNLSMEDFFNYRLPIYHWFFYLGKNFYSFWFIYFGIIIVIIQIWNKIYVINYQNTLKYTKLRYFYFTIFLFSIWYRNILDITRYLLACVVYVYFIINFLYYRKGKKRIIIFIFIHNSFIIFILLFYFIILLKKIGKNIKLLFFFLGFLILLLKLCEKKIYIGIKFLLGNNINAFTQRIDRYVIDKSEIFLILKNSRVELIKFSLMIITLIIFFKIILHIFKNKKRANFFSILIIEFYLIFFFLYDYYILNERIFILIYLLSINYFFYNLKCIKLNQIKVITSLVIINYLFFTISYLNIFYLNNNLPHLIRVDDIKSNILKSVYQPNIVSIITNKYTEDWLNERIKK